MVHILLDWLNVSILDYEVKWWRNVKTVSLKYHKEITIVRKIAQKFIRIVYMFVYLSTTDFSYWVFLKNRVYCKRLTSYFMLAN